MAMPFSMGRNLLCIYSKRHLGHPPEQRAAKQKHNRCDLLTHHYLLPTTSCTLSYGSECRRLLPTSYVLLSAAWCGVACSVGEERRGEERKREEKRGGKRRGGEDG